MAECGTYAGYQRHRRQGQKPVRCEACKKAQREYMAEWRKKNPVAARNIVKRSATAQKARHRALNKLAEWYPKEFRELYRAELGKPRQKESA